MSYSISENEIEENNASNVSLLNETQNTIEVDISSDDDDNNNNYYYDNDKSLTVMNFNDCKNNSDDDDDNNDDDDDDDNIIITINKLEEKLCYPKLQYGAVENTFQLTSLDESNFSDESVGFISNKQMLFNKMEFFVDSVQYPNDVCWTLNRVNDDSKATILKMFNERDGRKSIRYLREYVVFLVLSIQNSGAFKKAGNFHYLHSIALLLFYNDVDNNTSILMDFCVESINEGERFTCSLNEFVEKYRIRKIYYYLPSSHMVIKYLYSNIHPFFRQHKGKLYNLSSQYIFNVKNSKIEKYCIYQLCSNKPNCLGCMIHNIVSKVMRADIPVFKQQRTFASQLHALLCKFDISEGWIEFCGLKIYVYSVPKHIDSSILQRQPFHICYKPTNKKYLNGGNDDFKRPHSPTTTKYDARKHFNSSNQYSRYEVKQRNTDRKNKSNDNFEKNSIGKVVKKKEKNNDNDLRKKHDKMKEKGTDIFEDYVNQIWQEMFDGKIDNKNRPNKDDGDDINCGASTSSSNVDILSIY